MVITVNGRPVADLTPHRGSRRLSLSRAEVSELLGTHQADAELRDDLDRLAGETTDDVEQFR